MKDLIKTLVEACGPSGHEAQVRGLIEELARDKASELRTDVMGNLIALKKGRGGGKRVMIAAHMDEIGVIVTHLDKHGFARVTPIGGVSPVTLVGSRVQFVNGAVGVFGWEQWLRPNRSDKIPPWDELFVDVGATSPDDAPVKVGDAGCFMRPLADLGQRLVAKAMDDRLGCAVALQALLELGDSPNDVYFVFTTQEEVGVRGAMTSAFGIEPEVGLAVDVTDTGDTPESRPMAVSLGKGPAIKVMDSGMLTHPGVKNWMIRTAEQAAIPYQLEILDFGGTDAQSIQLSRQGVPAGCLSIPTRYIHTPSETADYGDVQNAVKLLVALLSGEIAL